MTMMVVAPLVSSLEQDFTYNLSDRLLVGGLRPYLYLHNNPAGTFKFEIIHEAQVIASATFTSADISTALSTSDLYIRTNFRLSFNQQFFLVNGDYTLKMSSTGYTYSDASYIAWHRMHENLINEIRYVPVNDGQKPLSFELWEYKT